MYEIVIASGKGGTGKTSLTRAFAELARPAVLVDCDVDAANLHLITKHRVIEEHDFYGGKRASINMERCVVCGICVDNCRFDAIKMIPDMKYSFGERVEVDPLACEGCGLCARLCQLDAVDFHEVKNGQWYLSETELGPFLHARLGTAESNSGRLVTLLRNRSREIAESKGLDMILIDGPPGIGCPTIATLTNASYLLIVTEPSLSAIHDMERLADLAAHFGIGTGICLNKFDINEKMGLQVERFAASRNIPILGRIPYDNAFTTAQLQGTSYMQVGSHAGIGIIKNIWQEVRMNAVSGGSGLKRRFAI